MTNIRVKLTKSENLSHYGKSTVTIPLDEYLRGVVPSEIKAGSCHMEAIEAQAVAARTFALNKIRHPRSENFDLYDNVNDQSYDVTDIHPRTDGAIKATAGLVLYYDGKLIDTPSYSNTNHGWTVPAEVKWHTSRPYLIKKYDPYDRRYKGYKGKAHGVGMSQIGANELAKLGGTYREILAFYYKDIQLCNLTTKEVEKLVSILRKGCKGEEVKQLQKAFLEKGYDLGKWGADGDFGRTTQRVLKAYQKDAGLPITGIFDEVTRKSLYGVDELTKATTAIQKFLGINETGKYDLFMANALMDKLGIEDEQPKPVEPPKPKPYPCTEHFSLKDFERIGKVPEKYYPVLQAEMEALEHIYEYLKPDEKVVIHHGYRTQEWQDRRYPGKLSMHLYAGAADISINGDNSRRGLHRMGEIVKKLYDKGVFGGVGMGNNCVHVDIRHLRLVDYPNYKAIWFYNGYRSYRQWFNGTK